MAKSHENSEFPSTDVKECLEAALIDAVKHEASMKGIEIPEEDKGISELDFVVDSLLVVDLLCEVEVLLDIELNTEIVQSGGYDSAAHALEHLLLGIQDQWVKHGGKTYEPVTQQ